MTERSNPPTLAELQNWMRWIVTNPQGVSAALSCAEGVRSEPGTSCPDFISAEGSLSREKRLGVYAEAYFARILESLGDDFPALKRRLGAEVFMKLVVDYLKVHPSCFDGLQAVGAALPGFLIQAGAVELGELAALEWKVMESFYAEILSDEEISMGGARLLSQVSPEDLPEQPLVFDLSLRLMKAGCDVDAFRRGETDDLKQGLFFIEIRRSGGQVEVSRISEGEFKALTLAMEGRCLAEICETLDSASPDDFRRWTSRWVEKRILLGTRDHS